MLTRLTQIALGAILGFLVPVMALGQTATLLPNAVQQYLDANGNPVSAGTVDYYVPNTTTRKTTWSSSTESVGTQNPNPVLLSAGGYPQNSSGAIAGTYGDGLYRQVVKDQNGNTIWDLVTSSSGSGGGTSPAFSEGIMVGTIVPWIGSTIPSKYLYTGGQGVSRTTYAALFTAVTFSVTILCSTGIQTIAVPTNVSDAVPIGTPIEAACFAPGTTVTSKSSGQLVMSTAATTTTSITALLFPWGNGDGSTTFNIPDLRGRVIAGSDNLNGTPAGVLTSNFYGANPDAIASSGGSQSHTLGLNELPTGITSVTAPGGVQITVTPAGGATGIPVTSTPGNVSSTTVATAGGAAVPTSTSGIWGGVGVFTGLNTINVTSNNTSGTAHSIVQPTTTMYYIIKALPDDVPGGPGVTSIQGMTGALTCGTSIVCSAQTISVSIAANSINNSQLAQAGAASFKANPTSSTANDQDITLQSLTAIVSPDPTLDFLPIYDHATNTIKKATISTVGTASGVSSIDGTVGVITGVDLNTLNNIASNYTVLTSDCGKTLRFASSSFTITLPAVAGFDTKCTINIVNADTTRGQKLSGFPSDLYNILYPKQAIIIKIVNGVWTTIANPGRWKNSAVNFFVDTAGSDSNDGLATGATGAFRTLNQCRAAAQVSIDTASQGNGGVTCNVPNGQTFQEFVQVFFPLVGGGSLIFQGTGGAFNWVPPNGSYALQFGDLGVVGITNVNFTTTGSTTPAGLVLGHNYGIIDFNTGVSFTANSPSVPDAMNCDFDAHFNINNGFSYVGTFTVALFNTCQNSSWNFNNAINSVGSTLLGKTFGIKTGSRVLFNGNVTWGTTGLSTTTGTITGGSVVNNVGGALPGGAPSPLNDTAHGWNAYCTALC
jgi:microcystin-dependent protein